MIKDNSTFYFFWGQYLATLNSLNSLGFVILYSFKWDNQSFDRVVLQNFKSYLVTGHYKNPIQQSALGLAHIQKYCCKLIFKNANQIGMHISNSFFCYKTAVWVQSIAGPKVLNSKISLVNFKTCRLDSEHFAQWQTFKLYAYIRPSPHTKNTIANLSLRIHISLRYFVTRQTANWESLQCTK